MLRRDLLRLAAAAPMSWTAVHGAPKTRITRSRISAISDEIAKSPAGAIAFAQQYGLKWLELRDVPAEKKTQTYFRLSEPELRQAAKEFSEGGVGISFLNTGMLKFPLPGADPLPGRNPETPEQREKRIARSQQMFATRLEDLNSAIRAAHILGCDKVRVFAFSRTAEPQALFPRIAEIIGEMEKIATREGITLLIENESSCNVATCAELAAMAKLVPSRVGINWDADNGQSRGEKPFPDGYDLLPHDRVKNVQIKGRTILDYPQHLDWAAIFHALERDGYDGEVGLETHIFGERQVEFSHQSMKEILKLVDAGS